MTICLINVRGVLADVSPSNSQQSSVGSKPVVESRDRIGLVLQLQHKLAEVDRERERLQKRVDEIDMSPKMETAMNAARDAIKISELELLNSKLKSSVLELEHAINQGTGAESLRAVVQSLQDELGRRSAEIVELKAILASQTDNLKSMISSNSRMGKSATCSNANRARPVLTVLHFPRSSSPKGFLLTPPIGQYSRNVAQLTRTFVPSLVRVSVNNADIFKGNAIILIDISKSNFHC